MPEKLPLIGLIDPFYILRKIAFFIARNNLPVTRGTDLRNHVTQTHNFIIYQYFRTLSYSHVTCTKLQACYTMLQGTVTACYMGFAEAM